MAKNSATTLKDRNAKRAHWKATIDPATVPRTIRRVCKDCKRERDCTWNHSFTQTGLPEYRAKCEECFARYLSRQRKINRRQYTRRQLAYRTARKHRCIELLGSKCALCGYAKSHKALTFHHKDPTTKLADVAKLLASGSWKRVLEEIQKCVLLCFNCHMEEEGRVNSSKYAVESPYVPKVHRPKDQ